MKNRPSNRASRARRARSYTARASGSRTAVEGRARDGGIRTQCTAAAAADSTDPDIEPVASVCVQHRDRQERRARAAGVDRGARDHAEVVDVAGDGDGVARTGDDAVVERDQGAVVPQHAAKPGAAREPDDLPARVDAERLAAGIAVERAEVLHAVL